jgi:hypothetical protein
MFALDKVLIHDRTGLVINFTKSETLQPTTIPNRKHLARLSPALILSRISSLALSVAALIS